MPCRRPARRPARSVHAERPEPLPRSLAQHRLGEPPTEGFGERVITGLPEGVSLRLEGETFKRVLALGAGGLANDSRRHVRCRLLHPREGWLGNDEMPVHLTLHPAPSRAGALAGAVPPRADRDRAQPGAPVGALTSEALAVGDNGAVARYKPGQGWLPESLLGPGERWRRRACARSPGRPPRAFAVGEARRKCGCGAPRRACGNATRRRR